MPTSGLRSAYRRGPRAPAWRPSASKQAAARPGGHTAVRRESQPGSRADGLCGVSRSGLGYLRPARYGQVGTLDVDTQTGEVLYTQQLLDELRRRNTRGAKRPGEPSRLRLGATYHTRLSYALSILSQTARARPGVCLRLVLLQWSCTGNSRWHRKILPGGLTTRAWWARRPAASCAWRSAGGLTGIWTRSGPLRASHSTRSRPKRRGSTRSGECWAPARLLGWERQHIFRTQFDPGLQILVGGGTAG